MNPYQEIHENLLPHFLGHYSKRNELVKQYAWAIPNDEAIAAIAKHSPIVEVGAGTGYWAMLIAEVGGKVDAYDKAPPTLKENPYKHSTLWFPVLPVEWLRWEHTRNKTLFLCWPPYGDSMAFDCLKVYRGKTVIYIGENDGCTGDDNFHTELDANWKLVEEVRIPQWDAIHDYVMIYVRD